MTGDAARSKVAVVAPCPPSAGGPQEGEGSGGLDTGKKDDLAVSEDAGDGVRATGKGECWPGICRKSQLQLPGIAKKRLEFSCMC